MDPVVRKRKLRPVAVGGEAAGVLSTPLSSASCFCIRCFVAGLRGSDSVLASHQLSALLCLNWPLSSAQAVSSLGFRGTRGHGTFSASHGSQGLSPSTGLAWGPDWPLFWGLCSDPGCSPDSLFCHPCSPVVTLH